MNHLITETMTKMYLHTIGLNPVEVVDCLEEFMYLHQMNWKEFDIRTDVEKEWYSGMYGNIHDYIDVEYRRNPKNRMPEKTQNTSVARIKKEFISGYGKTNLIDFENTDVNKEPVKDTYKNKKENDEKLKNEFDKIIDEL